MARGWRGRSEGVDFAYGHRCQYGPETTKGPGDLDLCDGGVCARRCKRLSWFVQPWWEEESKCQLP